jgi:hypothetical protein
MRVGTRSLWTSLGSLEHVSSLSAFEQALRAWSGVVSGSVRKSA